MFSDDEITPKKKMTFSHCCDLKNTTDPPVTSTLTPVCVCVCVGSYGETSTARFEVLSHKNMTTLI